MKTLLLFFLLTTSAYAYTDAEAVRCIVGEAEDQGMSGMIAIGEGIRNRGHLRGVYGCTSERSLLALPIIWSRAHEAWLESEHTDTVGLSDHWHSDREPPAWWEKYGKFVVKVGNHKFYKNVYK